jgi:hypothetical protein
VGHKKLIGPVDGWVFPRHAFYHHSSSGNAMLLSSFLTVSTLAGVALVTTNEEYCGACKAVETAISNASNVYYPGEHE